MPAAWALLVLLSSGFSTARQERKPFSRSRLLTSFGLSALPVACDTSRLRVGRELRRFWRQSRMMVRSSRSCCLPLPPSPFTVLDWTSHSMLSQKLPNRSVTNSKLGSDFAVAEALLGIGKSHASPLNGDPWRPLACWKNEKFEVSFSFKVF